MVKLRVFGRKPDYLPAALSQRRDVKGTVEADYRLACSGIFRVGHMRCRAVYHGTGALGYHYPVQRRGIRRAIIKLGRVSAPAGILRYLPHEGRFTCSRSALDDENFIERARRKYAFEYAVKALLRICRRKKFAYPVSHMCRLSAVIFFTYSGRKAACGFFFNALYAAIRANDKDFFKESE